MTTNHPTTPETSVMFSLAELANIEEDRVREEAAQRRKLERESAAAERERLAAERAAEDKRIAEDIARREQLERAKAEAAARAMARERAEMEIARIAAESQARLEAENAARAHELNVLRVKSDGGRARLRHVLAAVIGLVVLGGSAAAYGVNGRLHAIEREAQTLRDDRWALTQTHEQALSAELIALDARHDRLKSKTAISQQASVRAEAARSAIEAGGIDAPKLRAFDEALELLASRVVLENRVAQSDRRFADLSKWATDKRKTAVLDDARRAAAAAHTATADDDAAAAYDKTLDDAATALTASDERVRVAAAGTVTPPPQQTTGPKCTNPHDPMCGFGGEMLR